MNSSIIIANLSWNKDKWKKPIINKNANHSYTNSFPGHESLNFDFNKTIDIDNTVYGFAQFKNQPIKFENGGIVIFYSNNTDEKCGQIVGMYSNVTLLAPNKKTPYVSFQNNELLSNMRATKNLSILFPKYLSSDKYKKYTKKGKLTGQIGFAYYDDKNLVEEIIFDEIKLLLDSTVKYSNEIQILKQIYKYYINEEFDYDNIEQQKVIEDINVFPDLIDDESETIIINQKVYKRNNVLIAKIKSDRNFECQICQTKIQKSNGEFYIEAAHIKAKKDKGKEAKENILILCPNHHKEFDFGKREIIKHTSTSIAFKLNNIPYTLSLQ